MVLFRYCALSFVSLTFLSAFSLVFAEVAYEGDNVTIDNAAIVDSESTDQITSIREKEKTSAGESLRRQRIREEVKNEDILTRKLEELRLRDEMRRVEFLLGGAKSESSAQGNAALGATTQGDATQSAATQGAGAQGVASQSVGFAAQGPTQSTIAANISVNPAIDQVQEPSIQVMEPEAKSEENNQRISFTPRVGLANITNSMYDAQARYSMGVAVGMDVNDHLAVEGGYSYSTYGINAGGNVYSYNYMAIPQQNLQQVDLNDNTFTLGMKANLLSPQSRLRPFLGGGLGYRRGYINYDDRSLQYMRSVGVNTQDIEISGFAGYVETGLELALAKNISVVSSFRYFNMLSSTQSNTLSPYAFVHPSQYGYYGSSVYYNNDARVRASNALSQNNFYQLSLGVSVGF